MKKHTLPFSALVLAVAALPLGAQTSAHHAAAAHQTTAHHAATGGCVKVPEISPRIPALSANAPCPRALYTLTHIPTTHLDYVSPLVGPELRDDLSQKRVTYSLDYVDTKIGAGPLAQPGKYYTVHYTGYLVDGTKFDSSVDRHRPITFPYGKHRVIPGWDTGFEGMRVGGKRRLYIPYELAYGEAGRPPIIPAKADLIFDIELIAQSDKMPPMQPIQPNRPATPAAKPAASAAKPATPAAKPAASAAKPATTPPPTAKPQL